MFPHMAHMAIEMSLSLSACCPGTSGYLLRKNIAIFLYFLKNILVNRVVLIS